MARNTQTKFFAALEAIVAEVNDLEVINDAQYANTGTVRIEPKSGFTPALTFDYSFQDGYSGFDNVSPPIGGARIGYVKPEELETRVLAAIRRHLIAWDRAKRPGLAAAIDRQKGLTGES